MPLCSYLCETVGWDSVFYVFGALGIIWFIVWALLVHDGPETHPRISEEEKEYLQAALTECEAEKPSRIPWIRRGLSQIIILHICSFTDITNMYYYNIITIYDVRAVLCSIIKSPAVWAITATHVTQNFGYYVLLTELPTYMKNVLGWDLKDKVRGGSGF